jgi:LPS export ABC transporter protein LptC
MGLRLEIILSTFIVVIIFSIFMLKLTPSFSSTETLKKELEFTNTTFTEVNTEKLQGHLYGTYGVRYKGILSLKNIEYNSETIHKIVADKGTYKGDLLYLYGHVVLDEEEGYTYETEQANYNQKTETLYITAPFVGIRNKNRIKGNTLVYNTRTKKTSGTRIDSVLYTTEK